MVQKQREVAVGLDDRAGHSAGPDVRGTLRTNWRTGERLCCRPRAMVTDIEWGRLLVPERTVLAHRRRPMYCTQVITIGANDDFRIVYGNRRTSPNKETSAVLGRCTHLRDSSQCFSARIGICRQCRQFFNPVNKGAFVLYGLTIYSILMRQFSVLQSKAITI
jgi:hypothetical protein